MSALDAFPPTGQLVGPFSAHVASVPRRQHARALPTAEFQSFLTPVSQGGSNSSRGRTSATTPEMHPWAAELLVAVMCGHRFTFAHRSMTESGSNETSNVGWRVGRSGGR
eukprot:GHVU01030355.1.p1 GENE.GHVU01030355.1~~GHVU01030355.1.p1  ORF type:complete len:110 (-),score=2.67 GHVU01030355.1:803-1132(-)